MKKRLLIIPLVILISACDRNENTDSVVEVYRADVFSALTTYDAELIKARNELSFENGALVRNCDAYIKASKTSRVSEGVNNMIISAEYLMCDALSLVGKSRKLQQTDKAETAEVLASKLDLRSFPSSHYQRLDDKKHTLGTLSDKVVIDGSEASIDTGDWHFSLVHVASGDINNNGKADWIIWLIDEAKVGNYRGYVTLVAYDVDLSKALIQAKPVSN